MIEMNNKLKKEIWSINTKGTSGPNANTDIAFGITEDGKSALRIDDKILTGEGGTVPTITLDQSQIISFEETTIVVQLTAEQVDIFESNAPMINFDIIEGVVTLFATGNPSNRSSVLVPASNNTSGYMFARVDDDDKCYIDSLSIGA